MLVSASAQGIAKYSGLPKSLLQQPSYCSTLSKPLSHLHRAIHSQVIKSTYESYRNFPEPEWSGQSAAAAGPLGLTAVLCLVHLKHLSLARLQEQASLQTQLFMFQAVGAQAKAGSNGKNATLRAADNGDHTTSGTQPDKIAAAALPDNLAKASHSGVFQCGFCQQSLTLACCAACHMLTLTMRQVQVL